MSIEQPNTPNSSRQSRIVPSAERMADWPWWLVVAIIIALLIVLQIITNERMTIIFKAIAAGIVVTVRVTLIAYLAAVFIGLIVGFARVSKNKIVLNVASFYVEVIRVCPFWFC